MPEIPKIDKGLIIRRFARDMQSPTVEPTKGIIEGYPIVFNERTAIGDYFSRKSTRTRSTRRIYRTSNLW